MKAHTQKVVAYVVRGDEVLVFRHRDFPEAGLQVVAGTLEPGEDPASAVLREVAEESGLTDVAIARYLGSSTHDMAPYRNEVQERHFFLLSPSGPLSEAWRHEERHAATGEPVIVFDFFWMAIDRAAETLIAGQGALLPRIATPASDPPACES